MSKQLRATAPSSTIASVSPAETPRQHRPHCFAGQPAACQGYLAGDVLPCVCGLEETLQALSRIAIPVLPAGQDESSESQVMPLSA